MLAVIVAEKGHKGEREKEVLKEEVKKNEKAEEKAKEKMEEKMEEKMVEKAEKAYIEERGCPRQWVEEVQITGRDSFWRTRTLGPRPVDRFGVALGAEKVTNFTKTVQSKTGTN